MGDEAERIYQRQDQLNSNNAGDKRPAVAMWELLLRYADWLDCGAMAAGSLAAAVHGAAYPAYFLIFSNLINELGNYSALSPSSSASLVHRVSRYAEYFFYLGLVLMVSGWLEVSLWMYTGDRQCAKMRTLYVKALITQDVSFYDKDASTTKAMLGLSVDIALIQEAIGAKVGNFISYVCRFIAGFVIAFSSEWRLTLVTLCMMPILATAAGLYAYAMVALASESKQAYVRAGKIAEESISQIRTVQAFGSQERAFKSFSDALLLTRKLGHRSGFVKGLGIGSIYGMGLAAFSLLLWYSGRLIRDRITNGGQAFITIINVLASTLALGQAVPNMAAFSKARVSGHTILEMINKKPNIRQQKGQGIKLANIEGRIDIHDVSFSYPSRPDVKIFQNFSLSIPAGKVVSIVGGSGSGKSTVISLIERFYDPNSGEVLLDGHNIKTLDLKWLRNQLALVNQEPALFATTIKENILYGKEGYVSMDEIIQAASISCAHEFISTLPLGYETEVGERGIQLSGGQKQRIAIARAMLKDPSILLLDEATSALDADTEKSVQEALERVMVGRTTLVVAHRLSTIQKADLIAVMQEGKVVECGLHEELKDKGEVYASLIQIQEDSIRQAQEAVRYHNRLSHGSLSQRTGSFCSNADSTTKSVSGMKEGQSEVGQTLPAMHKNSWKRLLKGCLREWQCGLPAAFGALVAGAQTPLFALAITQGVVYFYSPDQEHMKKAISKISILCATIGFVAIIAYVCENYFAGVVGESLTMQIRKSMFSGILRNEIGWFDQHSTGLLTTQLSMDALIVRTATADRLITLLHNIGLVVTAFAIAFSIQWKVALVVIASYPIMIGANIGEMMFMKGFLGDSNKAYGTANIIASEAICNIRTVAAFSAENKVMEHFTKALEQPHKKAFVRGQVAGLGYGVSQLCVFSSYGLALWYSSSLMQKREAGFGEVMKCYMVLIITAFGIAEALALAPDMARSSEKISSVFEIVDRKTQIDADDPEGENVTELKGAIEFKQVGFSYPARMDVIVFQNLNLKVRAGQSLALVGASGSGKSSVITLIARFYDPQNGQVLVDGKDIKRMNLRSLRQHMGLVQQEPALFSTSIYENIRYGKEGASEAEVIDAAKAANAYCFICSLPEGFRTEVGERGVQLSGGQKQRVAIARAILRNPAILLLDEATSALDAESEKAIQQALERLMQHRTTVMAAHRLSTVQNAHSIAVLGNGTVVEQGSHHELLSKCGTYFNLLNLSACTDQPQATMP